MMAGEVIDDMPLSLTAWMAESRESEDFTSDILGEIDGNVIERIEHKRRHSRDKNKIYEHSGKENRNSIPKRHNLVEEQKYFLPFDKLGALNEIAELSGEERCGNSTIDNLNSSFNEIPKELVKAKPGRTPISSAKSHPKRLKSTTSKHGKVEQNQTFSEYSLPTQGITFRRLDFREPLTLISNVRENIGEYHQKTTSCSLYSRDMSKEFKDYLNKKSVERAIHKRRYDSISKERTPTRSYSKISIYQKSNQACSAISSRKRCKAGKPPVTPKQADPKFTPLNSTITQEHLHSLRGSAVSDYRPPPSISVVKSRSPSACIKQSKIRPRFESRLGQRCGTLFGQSCRSVAGMSDRVKSFQSCADIPSFAKGSPKEFQKRDGRTNLHQREGSGVNKTSLQSEARGKNVLSSVIDRILKRDTATKYNLQLKSQRRLN